jgi:hypothetical protein
VLTLIWDVDDVLNDLMKQWAKALRIPYAYLRSNPPHEILGMRLPEYLESLDKFRECGVRLTPNPRIRAWLSRHGLLVRNVALSSVPTKFRNSMDLWIFENFGQWIKSFIVAPGPRGAPDKREALSWFGLDCVLIDDLSRHVETAKELGLRSELWPQPWNESALSERETLARLTRIVHETL